MTLDQAGSMAEEYLQKCLKESPLVLGAPKPYDAGKAENPWVLTHEIGSLRRLTEKDMETEVTKVVTLIREKLGEKREFVMMEPDPENARALRISEGNLRMALVQQSNVTSGEVDVAIIHWWYAPK
jgi:hypothetical protein